MAFFLCRCTLRRAAAVCVLTIIALWYSARLSAQSAYISKVFEYRPAPGQFVNQLPQYTNGDTEDEMCQKAEKALADPETGSITLGGWGGYVVFGFDHEVENIEGEYDFQLLGNAFYQDEQHPENGGSSEPGVVYVSRDDNENGLPDDTWYELAGSEYTRSRTNYQLTYFRTSTTHTPTPKPEQHLVDTTYILWRDIDGNRGYIEKNMYHLQDYFPQWLSDERLVFNGTLLPPNAQSYVEDGITKYILTSYQFGYADNHPNSSAGSMMKIDWAVDQKGQPVNIRGIHFVKVMTGVNQQCGWIGETSTELSGAVDLHIQTASAVVQLDSNQLQKAKKVLVNGRIMVVKDGRTYNLLGMEE